MKNSKMQGRRPMPRMRNKMKKAEARHEPMTVGDLITAAFDALGDSRSVVRVLGSQNMGDRVGRRIVFI